MFFRAFNCLSTSLLLLSLLSVPAWADDSAAAADDKAAAADTAAADKLAITTHTATIGGREMEYTVTAGTLEMRTDDADPKAKASIFFVAYTKNGVEDLGSRPVSFCFNGGPGSSSIWLHIGMLAPRYVPINDDTTPSAPPHKLADNPHSLLDETDLVFIDPVSTGYSRPAAGEDKKQFHGYNEDIHSIAQFIHLYTTRYNRWQSPRFLIGESYGTLRAAGLSGYLLDRYKMDLNGIVLVSSVLDFATISFSENNDLPYILFLPTFTATAWYHNRLSADLQVDLRKTLDEARAFAIDEYSVALLKGDSLTDVERRLMVQKMARYTGLAPDFIDRQNLRISSYRFAKEFMSEQRKVVGRFDSRFTGVDRNPGKVHSDYDPSGTALFAPYTSALYHYLHNDLGVKRDRPYEVLTTNVRPWNYRQFTNGYANSLDALNDAMTRNTHMKVFVASGYYDLATPFLGSEYTFNHLGLGTVLRQNVTFEYYEAGHMMYVHGPSLIKLKSDLVRFYDTAIAD